MSILEDHILIGPYHNDTSDPNCYCSCKEFQVPSAIRYTKSQLTVKHLYHLLEVLSSNMERISKENTDER